MGITAIVLAGGASTRLGRPKQLLDLGGRPLLQRTLDHVLASTADDVIVVLGANRERIEAAIAPGRARIVHNPDWASGQSTSLRVGLAAAPGGSEAVLFVLGDQPLILSTAINAVLAAYRERRPPIITPVYGGEVGQPVLFDRALFAELAEVSGDQGAREVVRRHAREVMRLPVDDGSRPADVDDEAAYQQVLAAWGARGSAQPQ